MTLKKGINGLLILLFGIGIYGAGGLVLDEIRTGDGCPKIGIVPACAIILVCFVLPLIAHIKKKWNIVYFFFTSVAMIIAVYASVVQVTGQGECPQLDSGIPMCYISLTLFGLLIILKIISNRQQ